jgi:phosphate transport system protein
LDGHIVRTFDGDLTQLKMRVLEMGGLAIEQVRRAVQALIAEHDEDAHALITGDRRIDDYQATIEEETIGLIARRQPVATDLRLILTISKVALDLERIGHAGRKIARLGHELHQGADGVPLSRFYRDVKRMEGVSLSMVRDALDCFDRADLVGAEAVVRRDAEMDGEFHLAMRDLLTYALEDQRWIRHTIQTVFLLKALERVGDHARNIARAVPRIVSQESTAGRTQDVEKRSLTF